jgi:hypothetical protein
METDGLQDKVDVLVGDPKSFVDLRVSVQDDEWEKLITRKHSRKFVPRMLVAWLETAFELGVNRVQEPKIAAEGTWIEAGAQAGRFEVLTRELNSVDGGGRRIAAFRRNFERPAGAAVGKRAEDGAAAHGELVEITFDELMEGIGGGHERAY